MSGSWTPRAVRRTIHLRWLILIALLAVASCRELTAPPEPVPADLRVGSVLVLDEAGEPKVGTYLSFDNVGFVPSEDRLDWSDRTDSEGRIYPDLPAGKYWVQVAGIQFWQRAEVELGPEPFTLDPRPYIESGVVRVSDPTFPLENLDVVIETEVSRPFGSRNISSQGDIQADGSFRLVRPTEGSFAMFLQANGTLLCLAKELTLPAEAPLEFDVEVVFQQVELSLGGGDAPTGNCSIRATVGDDYIDRNCFIETNLVSFWAPPGIGTLRIAPLAGMPFQRQTKTWEFGEGPRPPIELGRWLLQLSYVTPQGTPLHGCTVRTRSATETPTSFYSGFGPDFSLYLNEGEYLIETDCSGFVQSLLRINVDGPYSATVVMQPEP